MEFLKIIIITSVCGGLFSPLIAWRIKNGISSDFSGKESYQYYFLSQFVIGILIWPAFAILFYAITLFLNENFSGFLVYTIIAISIFLLCFYIVKLIKASLCSN